MIADPNPRNPTASSPAGLICRSGHGAQRPIPVLDISLFVTILIPFLSSLVGQNL
jgi:hypothetical protein